MSREEVKDNLEADISFASGALPDELSRAGQAMSADENRRLTRFHNSVYGDDLPDNDRALDRLASDLDLVVIDGDSRPTIVPVIKTTRCRAWYDRPRYHYYVVVPGLGKVDLTSRERVLDPKVKAICDRIDVDVLRSYREAHKGGEFAKSYVMLSEADMQLMRDVVEQQRMNDSILG